MTSIFAPGLLQGRRILITGGGTGLGKSMGRRFLELGAKLVICGRRADVLAGTASEFRAELPHADVTEKSCDLRDPEAVETMIADVWKDAPLDVLVNNAAATFIAQTHKLSTRAVDAVLASTLHGALYATLAAGRRWIESGRKGVVLSILSTSTITGRAFTVPSAIAKSGLLAMTRSLAVEWGPRGVRLVAIAPGPFATPGASAQLHSEARGRTAGTLAENPLGRTGRHAELADLACFLVSDAGAYVNGEMVTIDGGQHLRMSGAEDLLRWSDEDWTAYRARRGIA
jgi:NAD(P)-dependent dehydrogenase (short-subunit alcohol dehydrogenase family)